MKIRVLTPSRQSLPIGEATPGAERARGDCPGGALTEEEEPNDIPEERDEHQEQEHQEHQDHEEILEEHGEVEESDEDPDVIREQIAKLEEKLARALARRAE
eukprot:Skav215738  [mRNA]  locus=scaffold2859:148038:149218:+ [translate_table: standard]